MKLLLTALLISTSHVFVDAMHGGNTRKIEQVPYMAELYKKFATGQYSFCGAAILSKHWVLTAAHCARSEVNQTSLHIRVKAVNTMINKSGQDGVLHNISKVVLHNKYSVDSRWQSDIALIELAEPIMLDDKSQTISISKKSPRIGDVVSISGYGDDYTIYGEVLKLGQQTIISRRDCKEQYKQTPQGNLAIDDRVFCTDSTTLDLCGGDSGSPGVMNGKVVGVAVDGCEAPLPNIYINVAHYYEWIVHVTGIKFD